MKTLNVIMAALIVSGGMFLGCDNHKVEAAAANRSVAMAQNIMPKLLGHQVVELPVIDTLDYEEIPGVVSLEKMGCSAFAKTLTNGDMVVGRSMDIFYSNSPAVVVRTAVPGFYKTVGLANRPFMGKKYAEILKCGYSQKEIQELYHFTFDIMNEKGFFIEVNMRDGQNGVNGIADITGTNPGAKVRMSAASLVRYLGNRCANVEEALALANKCDVYGFYNKEQGINWGAGIMMADTSGRCGVLEVIDNKLVWNEGAKLQTNFYLHPEYKDKAIYGAGVGRYELLKQCYSKIKTEQDVDDLIRKVNYSSVLNPDTCLFDPSSEFGGNSISFEGKMVELNRKTLGENPKLRAAANQCIKEDSYNKLTMSTQELRDEGQEWLSAWQVVANTNKRSLRVRFFEDNRLTYNIGL